MMETDKVWWHRYAPFYETVLKGRDIKNIAEIGVASGGSVEWLLNLFPDSLVYGADMNDTAFLDQRFIFCKLDQGDREQVRRFFSMNRFDLMIDDGSHMPEHQSISLIEGMRVLVPGGVFILEDVHVSFGHALRMGKGSAFTVLLGIEHFRSIGEDIGQIELEELSRYTQYSVEDVRFLVDSIESVLPWKRASLPFSCFNCRSSKFIYSRCKCVCGNDLLQQENSMTIVVVKKLGI